MPFFLPPLPHPHRGGKAGERVGLDIRMSCSMLTCYSMRFVAWALIFLALNLLSIVPTSLAAAANEQSATTQSGQRPVDPCAQPADSLPALKRAFNRGRIPTPAEITGSWVAVGFFAELDGRRLVKVAGTYGAVNAEYRTVPDTFTRIVNETLAPLARFPILHPVVTVPEMQTAEVDTNVTPAGKVSFTMTFVAVEGPLLITKIE